MARIQKQFVIGAVAAALIIAVLGLTKFLQVRAAIAEHSQMGPPPQAVTTQVVQKIEWEKTLSAIGELTPIRGANLAFEAPGIVQNIAFAPGQRAEKGELLAQLDVEIEKSQLQKAEAELKLAQQEFLRFERLISQNATSRSDYEGRAAEQAAKSAEVASLRATIDRRTLIAPFSGTLGTQQVALGEYAPAGKSIISLIDLSELYIDFSLPERYRKKVRVGMPLRFRSEAFPKKVFRADLTSIDPLIEQETRNMRLQAKTENTNGALLPGMFVSVEVVLPHRPRLISVPTSSIQFAPYGNTVYVVQEIEKEDGTKYTGVLPRNIRTGPEKGDKIAITAGLEEGETIVTSGTFKLFPTAPVIINNEVTPSDSFNPEPPNT
ncbi:efflux RND transporter periplasmic adaptor subunit [bacterium]|nr:efflux RND transporter periplasmic adaptor subunit [bacterium]